MGLLGAAVGGNNFPLGGDGRAIPIATPSPASLGVFNPNDPLGTDLSLWPDLDPSGALVSGARCLAQALLRRLTTPRGGLFYDPGYGTDIRDLIGESLATDGADSLAQAIEQEVSQDERVLLATATMTFDQRTNIVAGTLSIQTSSGPFTLVLSVSAVTVSLLQVS